MADINATKRIPTYTTDFGSQIRNLGFKILNRYANNQAVLNTYEDRQGTTNCGFGNLFSPRYLEVTFEQSDGNDVIKFPIPNNSRETITTIARRFIDQQEVVCVSYFGERWSRVPVSLLGENVAYNPSAAYAPSAGGNRLTGIYTYQADYTDNQLSVAYAIESIPETLATQIQRCLNNPVPNATCAEPREVRTRRFLGQARKKRQEALVRGSVVRTIQIADRGADALRNCGAIIAPLFQCLGYEGEQIRNLSALLN